MSGQPHIARGLGVLARLQEGPASLEDLAAAQALPSGLLRVPLNFLLSRGLVHKLEDGCSFAIVDLQTTQALAALFAQWNRYEDKTYRTLARDVAEIILTRSWRDLRISDVLLFGSVLMEIGAPNDIDIVILHDNNQKLIEFNPDPYGVRPERTTVTELPSGNNNDRYSATSIFQKLGYLSSQEKPAATLISERVGQSLGGKVDEEMMRQLFDVHVLHIGLLGYENNNAGQIVRYNRDIWESTRREAIASCRDSTFWHTVLTTGRLYDTKTRDFTLPVSTRYQGAIELFKVQK